MSSKIRLTKILDQLCHGVSLGRNDSLSSTAIELNDGNIIPLIAIGTNMVRAMKKYYIDYSKLSKQQIVTYNKEDSVDFQRLKLVIDSALKHGYRHIDCAEMYRTEHIIGDVLSKYLQRKQLKRNDVWITSKISTNKILRNDSQIRLQIDSSLNKLQLDYIDLFLIHSPHTLCLKGQRGKDVIHIYKILHQYKNKGKIKSVGVSNFGVKHLETLQRLLPHLPLPSVNQIEVHCFLYEKELIHYCLNKGIQIEAYCPLAKHCENVIHCTLLKELSDKYNKTYPQIMIKYLQQNGFIVISKTTKMKRLIENGNIFDFEMSAYDMTRLKTLNKYNKRVSWNALYEEWDL